MRILRVNLKHLYQRRGFWFLGLVFGSFAFVVAMVIFGAATKNQQGGFSAPIPWVLYIGIFIATQPIDVLTKPFSYCLPGHRNIPRKFLFSIGLVLSFLWSLGFFFFPDLNFVKTALACLAAFSTFTIFYWLGVWFVFRFRSWGAFLGLLPFLIFGNRWLNIGTIIEHAIVGSPLPMILFGGLVNYLAWGYLGRPNLARQYCGVLRMGAFDGWNREKVAKYKFARLAERDRKKPRSMRVSPTVEGFFISRIRGAKSGSLAQYIWGNLYKSFGIMISQQREEWLRCLVVLLPVVCFLCYMPGGAKNIIFIMPGIMVIHMSLSIYSSLLISGSRRERFWSALTLAATTTILVTVVVTFISVLTMLLELILPELTVRGNTFVFHSLSIKFFYVPSLMIPVTFIMSLIFHKKPMWAYIFLIVIFQVFFAVTVFEKLTIMNWPVWIVPVCGIIMLLCNWAVFVAVLHYISMRCCLVKQGR